MLNYGNTNKETGIRGRPARVEFISEVKRRMAEGQTHAQIKKELGIKDFKTLWRIKRYPEERLEKQREYAKIAA